MDSDPGVDEGEGDKPISEGSEMPISITNQSPYDSFPYFPISNLFSSLWGNIGKYDRDINDATFWEFYFWM